MQDRWREESMERPMPPSLALWIDEKNAAREYWKAVYGALEA
jgi:hypothetical protein